MRAPVSRSNHERKLNLIVVVATLAAIAALVVAALVLVDQAQPTGEDGMDNVVKSD